MNDQLTKWQLFSILTSKDGLIFIKGVTGILKEIQREDGSGNCFNLRIETRPFAGGSKIETVFVRTMD